MNNDNGKDMASAINDAANKTADKADAIGDSVKKTAQEGASKIDSVLDPVESPVDFTKAHESLTQLFSTVETAVRGDTAKEKLARAKIAEVLKSLENPAHQSVDFGEKAAKHAQRKVRHGWKHVKERAEKAHDCAHDCVEHHPMKSLGVAMVAGALLGAIFSRSGN